MILHRRLSRRSGVSLVAALALLIAASTSADANVPLRSDFNGDGYDDLVVALPGRMVDGVAGAGAIVIVPGSHEGVQPFEARQMLHRGFGAIPGTPTEGERWGTVLVTGDFNSDGFFDLAIGSPAAFVDGEPGRGDVVVLFGSRDGLRTDVANRLVPDPAMGAAAFGAALAAGPVNADPLPDLAIGAPGAFDGAGAVVVYHAALIGGLGNPVTLRPEGDVAAFGAALASGRFGPAADGPGDDLAIASLGGTGADVPPRIHIARGSGVGPATALALLPDGIDLGAIEGIAVGAAAVAILFAVGDFDGDGHDDLAVGLPDVDATGGDDIVERAGALVVIAGNPDGIALSEPELWLQDRAGFQAETEAYDFFATALAVGDFDGDGHDDLAIGTPLEDDIGLEDRGIINMLYGSSAGFTRATRSTIHFDLEFIGFPSLFGVALGQSSAGDLFGGGLGVGDFNGDGLSDVAIGIPGRAGPDGEENAGWVLVLHGSPQGATTAFARLVAHSTLRRLAPAVGENDHLGLVLGGGAANCARAAVCATLP